MLASIGESSGIVTVIATQQDDTVVISSANAGFTDISINAGQSGQAFARFTTSQIDKVVVWAGDGNDSVFSTALLPTEINGQAGDDRLEGGFADDIIRGHDGVNVLIGKNGNDRLLGGNDVDRFFAGSGDDEVFGFNGNDRVEAHAGNDLVSGGIGSDTVFGGPGDDLIVGGVGNDILHGHDGNDDVTGDEGNDLLYGQSGNDVLRGRAGNDTLVAGAGNDILVGFTGSDVLYGQSGDDTLDGSLGTDRLVGGSGEDYLDGGLDTDTDELNGGTGNDTFVERVNDIVEDRVNGSDSLIDVGSGQGSDGSAPPIVDPPTTGTLEIDTPFRRVAKTFCEVFNPSEFAEVLANLPLGATVDTFGAITVINTGARKLAFVTEQTRGATAPFVPPGPLVTTVRMLGNFPASVSQEAITQSNTLIQDLKGLQTLQSAGEFVLHTLPVGTLADYGINGEGTLGNVVIATAGDLTFVAGAFVKAAGGGTRFVKTVTAADIGVNSVAASNDIFRIYSDGGNAAAAGDLTFRVIAIMAGVKGLKAPVANNFSNAGTLAQVFERHGAGQGFTGVIDDATGELLLRPSRTGDNLPEGFVPRNGGHDIVSTALGGNRADHRGFAVIIQENGTLAVTWRSGILNRTPDSLVPVNLRPAIVAAIETSTGRIVSSF